MTTKPPKPARKWLPMGKRLKWLRTTHKLTQAEIAEAIGALATQWNHWETGLRPMPLDDAIKLCGWADVSLDWIFRGVDVR